MNMRHAAISAAALMTAAVAAPKAEASTTFDYTGSAFTGIQDTDFGTSLNAQVVTLADLATNFTGTLTSGFDFTLTAVGGTLTPVSSTTSGVLAKELDFTNGIPTGWNLGLDTPQLGGVVLGTRLNPLGTDTVNADALNVALAGKQNYTFNSGIWDRQAIATSGAPEPAAWTMMLAGFALTGLALRRSLRPGATAVSVTKAARKFDAA